MPFKVAHYTFTYSINSVEIWLNRIDGMMNKKNISETGKEMQFSLLGLGARTRFKVLSTKMAM